MSDDNGCRDCQGVTSGRCWRHGGVTIFRGETRIPVPPEAVDELRRLREELADVKSEALARWRALNESLAFNRELESEAAALRRTLDEARGLLRECYGSVDRDLRAAINTLLAPPAATPPPCASWCGTTPRVLHGAVCYPRGETHYCTPDCRDAGAPRNPEKPCETCHGERKVLWVYQRGPNDPPGNMYIPCPTCTPGAKPAPTR